MKQYIVLCGRRYLVLSTPVRQEWRFCSLAERRGRFVSPGGTGGVTDKTYNNIRESHITLVTITII